MPKVSKDEFAAFLQEAVPGRRRRLQEEEERRRSDPIRTGNALIDLPALASEVQGTGRDLYPTNPLSPEEQERLRSLSRRSEKLQPSGFLPFGSVGSQRIPGNPYSFDSRGAAQGIGNFLIALMNKAGEKKRGEVADELAPLQSQQQQNIENQESQAEFFQEFFPQYARDVFGAETDRREREDTQEFESTESEKERTFESQESDEEREFERNQTESDREFERQMETLRHENDVTLEEIRNENRAASGPSVQLMRDYVQSSTAEQNLIWEQLQNLYDIQNDPAGAQMWERQAPTDDEGNPIPLKDRISNLEKRYLNLNNEKANMIENMGQVPGRSSNQNAPGSEGQEGAKIISQQQLEDWAKAHMDGDLERARQIMRGRGYQIGGGNNP